MKQDLKQNSKVTDKEIEDALEKYYGNCYIVKNELGISNKRLDQFLEKNTSIILKNKNALVDRAYAVLIENLYSENEFLRQKSAEFIIKTHLVQEQSNINIQINDSDKEIKIQNIFGIDNLEK